MKRPTATTCRAAVLSAAEVTSYAPKTREWTPSSWIYSGNVFSTLRPLDDELGTGLVDAERALIQLDGGKQNANTGVTPIGWNIDTISSGHQDYGLNFAVTTGQFLDGHAELGSRRHENG